ncbi:NAD-dependent epimerase/dehydratase family protein [Microcoleus sp.]|uniref:NAD-dependent epimerase/dehydratase family protein n=1 Tax=Microcoleus sp. TaxID=44472 RepID=UPI0035236F24
MDSNPLAQDLDYILENTYNLWSELRSQRIFITGGTGFFGCWLLESLIWANDKLGLNTSVVVLTRNIESFRLKAPHLAEHSAIQFQIGDVTSFEFPTGEFSHVIHAATEASAKLNQENPLLMFETIVQGTRRTLEFAKLCQAKKFLLTSSGAVYGKQPSALTHIPEDYIGAPDPTHAQSAYGEGKRAAEMLCTLYGKQYGFETTIARCFAFVGPYMPLDAHFAIGNFIRDGLQGGPILVNGDGTPYRSYLYAADLAVWLWTILFKGKSCYPYNVGSDFDLSISRIAHLVAQVFQPQVEVIIAQKPLAGKEAERYVPLTNRALSDLGLKSMIGLDDAIKRTILSVVLER